MSSDGTSKDIYNDIPYLSLSYSNADSQTSALRLILTLFPDWEHSDGKIEFIRFKDGITNTVCLRLYGSMSSSKANMSTDHHSVAVESCQETPWLH